MLCGQHYILEEGIGCPTSLQLQWNSVPLTNCLHETLPFSLRLNQIEPGLGLISFLFLLMLMRCAWATCALRRPFLTSSQEAGDSHTSTSYSLKSLSKKSLRSSEVSQLARVSHNPRVDASAFLYGVVNDEVTLATEELTEDWI